ncbi:MAG TPA: DMT family transporter [Candidatus Angelobacter sp.]|jgi:drug/metabolite transporter (DMT)-like permease|nr:DMT family transporter [Candidatus Angelobacter sp.]
MNFATIEASGLSLLAAASWGGGDFAGGVASKRASVFRVVAVAHACGLVATLAMALLAGEPIPPASAMKWGAFAGLVGAFGIAALYRALAIGRMGVIAPVAAVVTGLLPVLVGIRTEGLPDRWQLAGFVLALASIWLVARPNEHVDSSRGIGLAVLAGMAFGLFLIAGKQAGHHAVFWPLVMARMVSTTLMVVMVALTPRDPQPLRPVLWPMVLSGLLDSAGNALFIAATQHGRLDVAAVLSSLYPASTVILARFLLHERIAKLQAVGIACAVGSIVLIAAR